MGSNDDHNWQDNSQYAIRDDQEVEAVVDQEVGCNRNDLKICFKKCSQFEGFYSEKKKK
jgi:hypothetical protein